MIEVAISRLAMLDIPKCCTKCGLFKPSSEFPKDNQMKNGLSSWCKQCRRAYDRARYHLNPEPRRECCREYWREYWRDLPEEQRECAREQLRSKRQLNQERYREHSRGYYRRDLEHSRAQSRAKAAIRRALLRGDITKPDYCEACGKLEREVAGGLEAHHYLGYAREHYLDVQWLCIEDHRKAERTMEELSASCSETRGEAETDIGSGAEVLC